MKTYPAELGDDVVFVPVAMSQSTYDRLLKLADKCSELAGGASHGSDVADVADLCEQAVQVALAHLDPKYGEI